MHVLVSRIDYSAMWGGAQVQIRSGMNVLCRCLIKHMGLAKICKLSGDDCLTFGYFHVEVRRKETFSKLRSCII